MAISVSRHVRPVDEIGSVDVTIPTEKGAWISARGRQEMLERRNHWDVCRYPTKHMMVPAAMLGWHGMDENV